MKTKILVTIYSPIGEERKYISEEHFCIGRSDKSNILINNEHLSRKHIEVKLIDNTLQVRDLETTNGSFLNTEKLAPKIWYDILETDKIKLGLDEVYIKLEAQTHIDKDSTKVVSIRPKAEEKTRSFKVSQLKNTNQTTIEPQVQITDSHPALDERINAVSSKFQEVDSPKLSEVQMLQIQQLEIQSKVAAIKIKEDADILANEIIQSANKKAQEIEVNSIHKIKDNNLKIESLENDIEKAQVKFNNLIKEQNRIESIIETLKATNEELNTEFNNQTKKIEDLNETYQDTKNKIESIESEHRDGIERLESEHINNINQFESKLKSIKQQIETEEASKKNLLQEQEQISIEIEKLKEREKDAAENYQSMQKRVDFIFKEKDELLQDIENLEKSIVKNKTLINDLESDFANKNEKLEQDLESLNSQIEIKNTELDNIKQRLETEYRNGFEENEKRLLEYKELRQKEVDDLLQENEEFAVSVREEMQERKDLFEEDLEQKRKEHLAKEEEIVRYELQQKKEIEDMRLQSNHEIEAKLIQIDKEIKETQDKMVNEYKETLELAKEKAESILNEAQIKAGQINHQINEELNKSNQRSHQIIEEAQNKSLKIQQDGLADLEARKKSLEVEEKTKLQAMDNLEKQVCAKKSELDSLEEKLVDEKENILQNARNQAQKLIQDANKKMQQTLSEVDQTKKSALEKATLEIKEMQKREKEEFDETVREEKAMLAKLRAQEVENLKNLRETEEANLKKLKSAKVSELTKNIESLVSVKIQQLNLKPATKTEIKNQFSDISKVVKDIMKDGAGKDSALLNSVNPYGKLGKGKSSLLMKKIFIGVGILISFVTVHFIWPDFYPAIKTSIMELVKVENSAKDLYIEGIQEKRKNKPKFAPELSPEFKKSMSDNVLYTSDFSKIWLDDKFQQNWTVKVDQIFAFKLQLPDQRVVSYINQEFKTIKKLQEIRSKIHLETSEKQIEQMRIIESQAMDNLRNIVGGQKNLNIMIKEQKKFFNGYKTN